MTVAIVILHFKGRKLTQQCLGSILKLVRKGFKLEVWVVNNNPSQSLSSLAKKFPQFSFIKTQKNLGYTGGNNFGIKKSINNGADWIFLVNNDTILNKDLVVQLIKAGKSDRKIGVLGPKIYFAPGYEYHYDQYRKSDRGKVFWYAGGLIDWKNVLGSHRGVDEVDQGQYDQQEETEFVTGCAMMVRKKVFEDIGLFDDRYYLYLEDLEFCQRAKKAGYKIVYSPVGKLWHANASSSEVGGELHDYFLTRNRLLFGWKYAPWRAKIALFRESGKILLAGRSWQKTAVRDFYLRKFNQGSWDRK